MMKSSHLTILIIAILCPACVSDQETGGGNLNPGLSTHKASIENFQNMRIGLSIHWGPSSLGGKEISWSRDKEIPKETYDSFYKEFNPDKFNAEEWVQLAKEGGMNYIVLTSKHHDGFCLWPSAYTDYDISNTPFKRNIVGELSAACKENNLVFGSYYSIIDWYHPDYQPYGHGGPGELISGFSGQPDFDRYINYMKNQLRELVLEYDAQIIQFDGEWDPTWNHQLGSDLYVYMRNLRDHLLVNNRVDVGRYHLNPETGMWDWKIYAGDFEERERMVDWVKEESYVYGKSDIPWQAWVTIDQAQWSWNETPRLLSADEIIIDLVKTIGDNGNYLINLGPRPDGSFHPEQIRIIQQVGKWVKKYSHTIYNTRGGPFSTEGKYTSTQKDNSIYLFVLDRTLKRIELNSSENKQVRITGNNGESIKHNMNGQVLTIHLPSQEADPIRIIKIELGVSQ